MKWTVEEFRLQLPLPANEKWTGGVWFAEAFKKGDVTLEFFAPNGIDHQSPHDADEFYFIVSGSGEIVIDGEMSSFGPGDVFFVPAQVEHRFENFSEHFATWVLFV